VAEADNGATGIESAEAIPSQAILMDVSMPVMGGFAAARELQKRKPELPIILVSQYSERAYADEAFHIGVRGYVVKRLAARELDQAVTAVLEGRTFLSPSI
jgi:DNA-binding NarL/FixJ family response regulator